ncbi:MAG: LPS export ABC transporter periplasmic protein LptC [Candidatus Omnitrophica bacterium CG11_big_fil_rev_8_21_14_0_20_45_26]|uniref:LPS export ABC transporter periplasmic protein LptC n=1 Tax=Candidatus Abzuiibacterium crystallinum TaxID=1974748 RepID=A0A2H0LMM8_9BACT|nr:MAG: LPS export ABC transporter periplasmic protein LptC [Candidatus Omnitrophica bacterium CG11_big_fil_rev_8_21_14_0_20_45_26]PIW65208.1 MAG: LPS export ABC transporter periplasmic protein LptC [Candidatus Omnitrophica bacterium CG12_big_fil_rev_8_21_14_0_65_45_16]
MIKQIVKITIGLALFYIGLVQFQLWLASRHPNVFDRQEYFERQEREQKIFSFAFSKYDTGGKKELEIEGDTADILKKQIFFTNVLAKAFAEDSPITITADTGIFDKKTSNVHLEKNVIATTKTGTRLLTEELDINPTDKVVTTPVHAKVKRENIHVEGIGAQGDSELKKVRFKRNVTVVVQNPDTNTPTIITSDGPLEVDYHSNVAHFSDNVIARDERGRLFADYMDVFYSQETKKIYKIIATGNVIITNKDGHTTYSDNVIYLADEGKIILGGDVEAFGAQESEGGQSEQSLSGFLENLGTSSKKKS